MSKRGLLLTYVQLSIFAQGKNNHENTKVRKHERDKLVNDKRKE